MEESPGCSFNRGNEHVTHRIARFQLEELHPNRMVLAFVNGHYPCLRYAARVFALAD